MGTPETGSAAVTDTDALRRTFSYFPSGVVAVAAVVDGLPSGIAASSFTSVSLDPPLVSVYIADTSTTWPSLRQAGTIGISVLAEHQTDTATQFASKTRDRFAGLAWEAGPGGAILLSGSAAWFECSLHDEIRTGDHILALLRIHTHSGDADLDPLVFHRSGFRSLRTT
ncbi:flavin reductase family protein [Nocardia salmonicida]|uniref:flavin reductase family protein n=1 Tax=Nocardia salmonicida TaxID=53431 RepID=UPI00367118F7